MEPLFQITQIFAVVNGLIAAALGAAKTDNDKLKFALSIGGFLITLLWLITARMITCSTGDLPN